MEPGEEARSAAKHLGDAIDSAISNSEDVADAIARLRELGYEANVSLKLEIALGTPDGEAAEEDFESQLTEEDLKTLERMRIRLS